MSEELLETLRAARIEVTPSVDRKHDAFSIDMLGKVEVRTHSFPRLHRWLNRVDALIVRRDRSKPLVVVPLATLIELIKKDRR
jgi:hypothetical protein